MPTTPRNQGYILLVSLAAAAGFADGLAAGFLAPFFPFLPFVECAVAAALPFDDVSVAGIWPCIGEGCCATTIAGAASNASVRRDRKSTRLNSSHLVISYAVFCLQKKKYPWSARSGSP